MKEIFYNGNVYTGELPFVEAFAVEDGKIVFSGSSNEALALAGSGDTLTDLGGRFVCSGFNDSHMHLLSYGFALQSATLAEHTSSLSGMIEYMRQFLAEHPVADGAWMFGRGWNQDFFADTDQMPTRYDLDKVSAHVPIYAVRACGHCLVVNSRALEILGITADTAQVKGGNFEIENGEPNGRFFDNAMDLVYSRIPAPDKNAVKKMIVDACRALNSYGVTSSQTDDYCLSRQIPWQTINDAYRELEQSGELTVRVYEQANFTSVPALAEFIDAGNVTGAGTDMFKIGPLKMLGDGALGAHTAYLSRPYADAPETCGIPVFTQELMDDMVEYANDHGMQVAVHAIGDACLDRVLHAVERALEKTPRTDHRHGIVHCQITRPDQLKKLMELNMHIYAQSIFLDYDIHIVKERVGQELASTSYSWKTLKDGGCSVSNGTDCPVELPFSLGGIQCAVTRKTLKGDTEAYLPGEAFSVREAIDSYTIASAEGSFEENTKGRLIPGMLADFVVLDKSPFDVPADEIKDIPVYATYLGGRRVY